MQTPARSLKNEFLTAVVALLMLGIAVSLAAILTGGPDADASQETLTAASPTPASVAVLATPVITDTAPPIAPPIALPTATATLPPTRVRATAALPPTDLPTAGMTPTVQPSSTQAPTLTPWPTDTPAPSPTPTFTLTPRPTRTPVPRVTTSATPTLHPTDTPPPPPTLTVTLPATLTATLTITVAVPETSMPTATIVLVTPITPTAYTCAPPPDWRPYMIRPGDNLFRISLRAGLPLQEIQRVNCIPNAASITAGTILYVPSTFFYSSASTTGSAIDTITSSIPRMAGCSASGSQIAAPSAGAVITGRFTVTGSATLGDRNAEFNFYKLELRAEGEEAVVNIHQAPSPVSQGALGTVNTAQFGAGNYQLTLTVVDETGNYLPPCAIRLTFR